MIVSTIKAVRNIQKSQLSGTVRKSACIHPGGCRLDFCRSNLMPAWDERRLRSAKDPQWSMQLHGSLCQMLKKSGVRVIWVTVLHVSVVYTCSDISDEYSMIITIFKTITGFPCYFRFSLLLSPIASWLKHNKEMEEFTVYLLSDAQPSRVASSIVDCTFSPRSEERSFDQQQ